MTFPFLGGRLKKKAGPAADVERTFSGLGYIYGKYRQRLGPERAHKLLVVQRFLTQVDSDGEEEDLFDSL